MYQVDCSVLLDGKKFYEMSIWNMYCRKKSYVFLTAVMYAFSMLMICLLYTSANDFVVAKTRQNRIIGSPLTDSKIDYKTNQWKVHDFVFHIKCAPFYFTDDSNSHIINNAFDHLAGVYM